LRAKKVTKEGTREGSSDPPLPLTPPFQTAEGDTPSGFPRVCERFIVL